MHNRRSGGNLQDIFLSLCPSADGNSYIASPLPMRQEDQQATGPTKKQYDQVLDRDWHNAALSYPTVLL